MKEEIASLSFEEALKSLEHIVRLLETGKEGLEASVNAYEKGMALKSHCEQMLQAAKLKVDQITKDAVSGDVTLVPFSVEE